MKYALGKMTMENDITPEATQEEVMSTDDAMALQEASVNEVEEIADNLESYTTEVSNMADVQSEGSDLLPKVDSMTQEQAEEIAAKIESDISSSLANIGGTFRSGRFSQSILGSKYENDLSRLNGKYRFYKTMEGVSDIISKIWEKIKAFFKMLKDKVVAIFKKAKGLTRASIARIEEIKGKIEAMNENDFLSYNGGDDDQALASVVMFQSIDAIFEYQYKIVDASKIVAEKIEDFKKDFGKGSDILNLNVQELINIPAKDKLAPSVMQNKEDGDCYKLMPTDDGVLVVTDVEYDKGIKVVGTKVVPVKNNFNSFAAKKDYILDICTMAIDYSKLFDKESNSLIAKTDEVEKYMFECQDVMKANEGKLAPNEELRYNKLLSSFFKVYSDLFKYGTRVEITYLNAIKQACKGCGVEVVK